MAEFARVFIATDGIAMSVLQAGVAQTLLRQPPRVLRTHWQPAPDNAWASLIATLQQTVGSLAKGCRVELLLSTAHLRLAVLPFNKAFDDTALQFTAAQSLIRHHYRLPAQQLQRIAVDAPRWGTASLVAALDETRATELESLFMQAGLRLRRIRPAVYAALEAMPASSTPAPPATLCFIEGDRCVVFTREPKTMTALQVLPFDPADVQASLRAAQRDAVCMGVSAPGYRVEPTADRPAIAQELLAQPEKKDTRKLHWVLLNTKPTPHMNLTRATPTRLMPVLILIAAFAAILQINTALSMQAQLTSLHGDAHAQASPENADSRYTRPLADASTHMTDQALASLRQSLQLPWESLLDTLSTHAPTTITLASVMPDATLGTADIAGTAPDRQTFLNFVSALRQDPRITSAMPVSDEPGSATSPGELAFRLRVTWNTTP